jgi:pilus assembly protein Flp/PilA
VSKIRITTAWKAFWNREEGLTTVEYAIAGGLVGLAVVLAFQALGLQVGVVINAITAILPA